MYKIYKKQLSKLEEDAFDEIVFKALDLARQCFRDCISEHGYESAYADIRFTAWVKDVTFEHRLRRVEIEEECK
jgi:hypothetical protein